MNAHKNYRSLVIIAIYFYILCYVVWCILLDMRFPRSLTVSLINKFQEQPSRDVLMKRYSENMQQIYRRTPIPKCHFNIVAKQLYWNRNSAWVFSCEFTSYFKAASVCGFFTDRSDFGELLHMARSIWIPLLILLGNYFITVGGWLERALMQSGLLLVSQKGRCFFLPRLKTVSKYPFQ